MPGVKAGTRQIVNAESAVADDLVQLIHPDLTPVIFLASATCNESAIVNGEDQSFQQLLRSGFLSGRRDLFRRLGRTEAKVTEVALTKRSTHGARFSGSRHLYRSCSLASLRKRDRACFDAEGWFLRHFKPVFNYSNTSRRPYFGSIITSST